jgi:hypothetical protein
MEDSLSRGEGGEGEGDILLTDFNPDKAWSSSYTNRKMNASFSMYKLPVA